MMTLPPTSIPTTSLIIFIILLLFISKSQAFISSSNTNNNGNRFSRLFPRFGIKPISTSQQQSEFEFDFEFEASQEEEHRIPTNGKDKNSLSSASLSSSSLSMKNERRIQSMDDLVEGGVGSERHPTMLSTRSSFFSSCAAVATIAMVGSTTNTKSQIASACSTTMVSDTSSFSSPFSSTTTTARGLSSSMLLSQNTNTNINNNKMNNNSSSSTTTALQESLSGAIAGGALAATKTIVKFPLDTVTVRLQMPSNSNKYTTTTSNINDIFNLFRGSYNGITLSLLSNIPAGIVFFSVKDFTKQLLLHQILQTTSSSVPPPKWIITSLAVAAAQIPYWIIRNPSEVIKVRQQAGIDGYGEGVSAWDAIQTTLQKRRNDPPPQVVNGDDDKLPPFDKDDKDGSSRGLGEFYTGYLENIIYAYPADVIKFIAYESITNGRKDLSPSEGALAGAMATAIAQFVTTPLDVVRNRLMTRQQQQSRTVLTSTLSSRSDNEITTTSNEKENNRVTQYIQALTTLAKEEGLAGLFAGATPRVGKAALSGAVQFATYEETKQTIANFLQQR